MRPSSDISALGPSCRGFLNISTAVCRKLSVSIKKVISSDERRKTCGIRIDQRGLRTLMSAYHQALVALM